MIENFARGLQHWPVASLICCSLIPQDFPAATAGPQETLYSHLMTVQGFPLGKLLGDALSSNWNDCWNLCSAFLLSQSMWKTQRSTVKGYFLAGGQMVWWPVSIFMVTLLVPLEYSKTEKHFCPSRPYFFKQKEKPNPKAFHVLQRPSYNSGVFFHIWDWHLPEPCTPREPACPLAKPDWFCMLWSGDFQN